MAIARNQAVVSTLDSGFRPLSISDEILNLRPGQDAILTLLMLQNKITVDSYEFRMNVQQIDPGTVTTTALNAGTPSVTVSTDDAKFVRAGMDLRLTHSVSNRVVSVDYATGVITLTATTGFTSGDVLTLGSAGSEELSNRPTAISRIPTQLTNYVETLRDAYGQSRHVQNERFYGGPRQFHNRNLCLWEHKRAIDRGLWYNVKASTTLNNQALLKTGGLMSLITTNIHQFSSNTITWDKMRANMTDDTRFISSPNIWLFVSRLGLELIEKICRDKSVPVTPKEAGNVQITELGMAGKKLKIIVVDHFESGELEQVMVGIDPDAIEIVTTADRTTKQRQWMLESTLKREQNTDGTDGTLGDVLTDFGLRINGEKRCFLWYDAASAA